MLSTTNRDIVQSTRITILSAIPLAETKIELGPPLVYFIQFLINHGTPNESKIASEFAPNEFETPIPFSPEKKRKISMDVF